MLQSILIDALQSNLIQTPSTRGSTQDFPVIQYVDDIILVMPAIESQLLQVNNLLAHYVDQTCLKINYHKYVLVSINVEVDNPTRLTNLLGCKQGSFQFTYLGLPMSSSRLKIEDITWIF